MAHLVRRSTMTGAVTLYESPLLFTTTSPESSIKMVWASRLGNTARTSGTAGVAGFAVAVRRVRVVVFVAVVLRGRPRFFGVVTAASLGLFLLPGGRPRRFGVPLDCARSTVPASAVVVTFAPPSASWGSNAAHPLFGCGTALGR